MTQTKNSYTFTFPILETNFTSSKRMFEIINTEDFTYKISSFCKLISHYNFTYVLCNKCRQFYE